LCSQGTESNAGHILQLLETCSWQSLFHHVHCYWHIFCDKMWPGLCQKKTRNSETYHLFSDAIQHVIISIICKACCSYMITRCSNTLSISQTCPHVMYSLL
jgi:hypothetical protein